MSPPAQPKNFTPAGRILSAYFAEPKTVPPMLLAPRKSTGSKAAGIRYERKAKLAHARKYGLRYIEGPWLAFHNDTSSPRRFCQPDALLFDLDNALLTVFEYKLSHTDYAWWQLNHLYIPVLEAMFPFTRIAGVEVCKWFDGGVTTSAEVRMLRNPEDCHNYSNRVGWPDFFAHIFKA